MQFHAVQPLLPFELGLSLVAVVAQNTNLQHRPDSFRSQLPGGSDIGSRTGSLAAQLSSDQGWC